MIQPQRGYDAFTDRDIHSPDLPPPHRYLAQYFWIEKGREHLKWTDIPIKQKYLPGVPYYEADLTNVKLKGFG